jgi:hypothetical protein
MVPIHEPGRPSSEQIGMESVQFYSVQYTCEWFPIREPGNSSSEPLGMESLLYSGMYLKIHCKSVPVESLLYSGMYLKIHCKSVPVINNIRYDDNKSIAINE